MGYSNHLEKSTYFFTYVVIMNSRKIFDAANLVQMLGRVGRGLDSKGNSYIISDHHSPSIDETVKYIRKANSYL